MTDRGRGALNSIQRFFAPVERDTQVSFQDSFVADLRSVLPGVDFQARFAVTGRGPVGASPADVYAMRQLLFRAASDVTVHESAARAANAQNAVSATLAPERQLPGRDLVLSASVFLNVTSEAAALAREWDRLQSDLSLGQLRQQAEWNTLEYLRTKVLSRPDVARAYWLKNHPQGSLSDLLDDRFERIAERYAETGAGPDLSIARLLVEFTNDLDAGQRGYLIAQLGRVFSSFGRDDLAERMPT